MRASASILKTPPTPANVSRNLPAFRRALLHWYDAHRRDLPWRGTRDPYRIWLSEIMLQQTRVAAVLEHYRIFLERFPGIDALAASSEADVLAAWSGLGYYRRARMLRECAKQVIEQHAGVFPAKCEALRALPGIGRYTAAAIASIAFNEPAAVVDGNVERVLQRMIGSTLTTRQTWEHAQGFLARSRPGDFNQAMMELGATVCVPREPRCLVCPVRRWCATRGEIRRSEAPLRQKQKEIWCILNWRAGDGNGGGMGKVRLVQRPHKDSIMPSMWELPLSAVPPSTTQAATHWRTFRHSITVTNYKVHVVRNEHSRRSALPDVRFGTEGKWIGLDRVPELPLTGLTRKILKANGMI
ncbi:MAG: A/G-specific adenine glycosylase [Terriglobales bacterium]|jgi:A/G-specific adenine glycosylase